MAHFLWCGRCFLCQMDFELTPFVCWTLDDFGTGFPKIGHICVIAAGPPSENGTTIGEKKSVGVGMRRPRGLLPKHSAEEEIDRPAYVKSLAV